MNTTVQALQALYVKLGGSLTDTYDNIADGATVADYAIIPDMVDAIAQISKAENLINSVSNDDNGKVLTVVNGAAEFAEPGTNTFIATYTTDTLDEGANISCDKTASEICAAYESGKAITARLTGMTDMPVVMHLFSIASIPGQNVISFSALGAAGHQFVGVGVIHVGDDNGNDQITISNIKISDI